LSFSAMMLPSSAAAALAGRARFATSGRFFAAVFAGLRTADLPMAIAASYTSRSASGTSPFGAWNYALDAAARMGNDGSVPALILQAVLGTIP